jgi:hypothetical protein
LRQAAHVRGKLVRRCRIEQLEARALLAGLVQSDDLNYLGAFNVPQGDLGVSTFEYGGTAIAYNPAERSLLMVGHDWDQAIAEIDIPEFGSGPVTQLPTGAMLQPFSKVLGRVPERTLEPSEIIKVGGLAVDGDRIIGTAYEYYDGAGNAVDSHFTLSSLNLATAQVDGLHQVGELGGGFVGGYMTQVPQEWQAEVGAPYLTGQAALSIISRTSAGPAAFGFDPEDLGPTTAPVEPLVYYPIDHPLAPVESQNPLFNTTTQIRGVVMPEGTDSVLFIGSHGVGEWWYGDDNGDPFRHDQGPHAPPYVYQVWAYDIHDLIAVRDGLLQPWEAQPYDVWQLDLPYADGANEIGGVAYDAASGQIFVSQLHGNDAYPVVHAFDLDVPAPPGDPVLSPPALSNKYVAENNAATSVLVGTLSATSPDPSATLSFALTAGEGDQDNSAFEIVGSQLFVRPGESLDFETQANYSIRVRVAESLDSFAERTFSIQVTNTNDAPQLDATALASLASIQEEQRTSAGSPIEMLLAGITDQDSGSLAGIAVTGISGSDGGVWQYSLNSGSTWNALGTPANSAARLLPATGNARLRFVPNVDFSGDVTVQYHAWDQTQGIAGGTFDLSDALTVGGTQAFSSAAGESTLSVFAINDAPRLNATLATVLDPVLEDDADPAGTAIETLLGGVTDADTDALRGTAVTAVTGATSGVWQYTLDAGATWEPLGVPTASAARLLPADGLTKVRFLPKLNYTGQVTLSFRAWDQTQGTSGETFDVSKTASRGGATAFSTSAEAAALVVAPVNDAPVLGGISGSVGYTRNGPAVVLAPSATVTDVDSANFAGGTLTVEVSGGIEASNRLEIGGTTFSLVGSEIYKSGLLIGTISSDGVGLNKLEIVFTEGATKAVVQQLLRSIRFRTLGDSSLEPRTIAFSVTDGDEGVSASATKVVTVR